MKWSGSKMQQGEEAHVRLSVEQPVGSVVGRPLQMETSIERASWAWATLS